jgi:TIR domain
MKIFLSHSSAQKPLVNSIVNHLPRHIQSWIDETDLLAGETITRSIRDAINTATDFVVIFVDSSAVRSDWVKREMEWALQREGTLGRPFIVPIVIEQEALKEWGPSLNERKYIPCHDRTESGVRLVAEQLAAELFKLLARQLDKSKNELAINDHDLAALFWEPYVRSGKPTRIIYPEPQFFRDDKHTYLRNQEADQRDRKEAFSYLNIEGGLAPSYSFVPSGIVKAMLYLIEYLNRHRTKVVAKSLYPATPFDDSDENVIILGTPGMIDFIPVLEARYPIHTQRDGVEVVPPGNGPTRKLIDDTQDNMNARQVHLVKWAVLTRRPHIHRDSITTVLGAAHGRSIEAIAGFLTRTPELQILLGNLGCQDKFPRQMQALFRVQMLKTEGEPHIDNIEVESTVNLDRSDRVARHRPIS